MARNCFLENVEGWQPGCPCSFRHRSRLKTHLLWEATWQSVVPSVSTPLVSLKKIRHSSADCARAIDPRASPTPHTASTPRLLAILRMCPPFAPASFWGSDRSVEGQYNVGAGAGRGPVNGAWMPA